MIVFSNASGGILQSTPDRVFQGSSLSGTVFFVAPFDSNNAVTVAFELPNGKTTQEYLMTASAQKLEEVKDPRGNNYSVWEWLFSNKEVTQLIGQVKVQFKVYMPPTVPDNYDPNNTPVILSELLTTAMTSFDVEKGVVSPVSEPPSENQWEQIITMLNYLQNRLLNKSLFDFTLDPNTGYGTKTYTDNTTTTFQYLNATSEASGSGSTIITFTESSWQLVNGVYEIAFGSEQTGFKNDKYFAFVESSGTETYESEANETSPVQKDGFYQLADTLFKGSDGSLLISANNAFAGRVIIAENGSLNDCECEALTNEEILIILNS